jgi:hypothetical protein
VVKLKFGKGNAKLNKLIYTFSLPAGFACPGSKECKSRAMLDSKTNKLSIKDGPHTKFRCFAASQEVLYRNTYNARRHNFELLKSLGKDSNKIADLIEYSLPKKAKYVRVHVSGDFYSPAYFAAWILVAKRNPGVIFYAYTKSLPYWKTHKNNKPDNMRLTASWGGHYDSLILSEGFRSARVVFSEAEAEELGLELDHDDSHAIEMGPSFALLIHGSQPKGSDAAKAKAALKGKGSYTAQKNKKKARKLKVVS